MPCTTSSWRKMVLTACGKILLGLTSGSGLASQTTVMEPRGSTWELKKSRRLTPGCWTQRPLESCPRLATGKGLSQPEVIPDSDSDSAEDKDCTECAPVSLVPFEVFRLCLVKHFDILSDKGSLQWPSRSGIGGQPVVKMPRAWGDIS